ncbi:MAG: hypothetical protein WAM28_00415 [Chlamydiales bacterium]
MNGRWIRVRDYENGVSHIKLADILQEVFGGDALNWSILFLDGILNPRANISIQELEKKINKSERGLSVSWKDLLALSKNFSQIYEIVLLGCVNVNLLKRYASEEEMHKNCNIVIELVDCAFWEIYSKDNRVIKALKNKFRNIEELNNKNQMYE